MNGLVLLCCVVLYFLVLIGISFITGRKDSNYSFFLGERKSPWYVVAFGMIGASLSGVTFISVPGFVRDNQFSYMQIVLGYFIGYIIVAHVLLPLYYRMNLTSIYVYLKERFGSHSYKSGAVLFLISRIIGASFRLYLVAIVFELIFDRLGIQIPFFVTVVITVLLIWLYTFRSGIKTIIWTDTLQTAFMLIAVGYSIIQIQDALGMTGSELIQSIQSSEMSKWFFSEDVYSSKYFIKQILSGMFITIVMTGLDQDMMQKNLTCKDLPSAKKNMLVFGTVLVGVNLVFLSLGALLIIYGQHLGVELPEKADYIYPVLALDGYLGPVVGILFILGLIASAYSSADSALTSLTTSFCIDILGIENKPESEQVALRKKVHVLMSIALVFVIFLLKFINDESVIKNLLIIAGFTYGPLLGMYSYGLFTKRQVVDKFVPYIAVISPIICGTMYFGIPKIYPEFKFGYEMLLINGMITFIGLWLVSTGFLKKGAE